MEIKTDEGIARKLELQKLLKEVAEAFNSKSSAGNENQNLTQADSEIDCLNRGFKAIISAIRGPDVKNLQSVKWQTTAKIRAMIGMTADSCLDVNTDKLTWPQFRILENKLLNQSEHFTYHISDAMRGLEVLLDVDLGPR